MVVFVMASVAVGMVAAIAALVSGLSFLLALLIYVGVGISAMVLILIRALICLHLKDPAKTLSPSA